MLLPIEKEGKKFLFFASPAPKQQKNGKIQKAVIE